MTTIAYDRSVKDFIDELNATGHITNVMYEKTGVTIHHNAGRLSHEGVLNVWKVRPASAHFDVDRAGAVCQYAKVNAYAWHAGNTEGNKRTIGIEMANSTLGPSWEVSETTWKSAARLTGWLFANVIKGRPRPSSANVFQHKHWRSTVCAGPHMDKVWSQFLAEAGKAYDYFKGKTTSSPSKPAPTKPAPTKPAPSRKPNEQIAAEVWAGKWGSGDERRRRLQAAGYNYNVIQTLVNRGVGRHPASKVQPSKASITTVARQVIAGKWGNGADRRRRLTNSGYNYDQVQAEVNRLLR